ncbi:hypothetical protein CcaverHIS002_0102650 [Cutaneotrichosporon cavernicola]|uniref:Uncharacterized protein n=1 Tax=Cutaneotrichosporon cavernicola TaxID=279322 RepID=A0AA48IB23_9TREE|nr:uncharacterized protein CcaverHIS019_0102590 [Cutaneotrichosporon cavernicola]BEI79736.1 hypothetical protein CcaverHIS002_0102650 [Cutaneotrichosporon cavernicola]BEI87541.1 hypothetical protein CcaverHIS019_0102590 [Cutaneotrichosporon cavernicola]BEI95313.1 hypothetical protein CcaverHIS631_0102620 [Cutaneotrichosporon cavernicola]BEJ03086.1 hypothetical protein CcaverHIS641_0102610 [Cutaneotrichosporon cavernicola]
MDNPNAPTEFTFNPFDFENDLGQITAGQNEELSNYGLSSGMTNATREEALDPIAAFDRMRTHIYDTSPLVARQPNQNPPPRYGDTLGWTYPNPENIWRHTTRFDAVLRPIGPNEPRNGSLFVSRPDPHGPHPTNLRTTGNTWAEAEQDRWQEEIVALNGRDGPSARRRAMERNDELFARRYESHFSAIQAGEAAVIRSLEDQIRVLANQVSTMGTAGWYSRVQIEVLRRRMEAFHNSELDRANVARTVVRQPFPAIPNSAGFGWISTRINPPGPARLDPNMQNIWGYP